MLTAPVLATIAVGAAIEIVSCRRPPQRPQLPHAAEYQWLRPQLRRRWVFRISDLWTGWPLDHRGAQL